MRERKAENTSLSNQERMSVHVKFRTLYFNHVTVFIVGSLRTS